MAKGKKGWFDWAFEGSGSEETVENTSEETTEEVNVSNSSGIVTDTGISTPAFEAMNIPFSGDGVFDQKFFDFFQGIIKDNNIPGIDYFEYREALKTMKALPENTAFQMAFDNFKIIDESFSKEVILSSIDHYDGLLAKEEKDFEAEMSSETESEVNARRQKATDLQTSNVDILQQIQNLQEKISHNQEEAIKLNNEAALAEVKIGQTAKNFTKTLTHVRIALDTDKTKVGALVQETKTA
jgi:hypothetical protein